MKRDNFASIEAAYARSTQRNFAELNQAIRTLRDNTAGLRRTLKVPVPRGGSRYTKSVRTYPSIFEKAGIESIGKLLAGGLLSETGLNTGSFYTSAAQSASLWNDTVQLGQRIR